MKHLFFTFFLVTVVFTSQAKLAPKTWEQFVSFSSPFKVEEAGTRIYFASDGGLFYVDKTDNSVNTFTKMDGLSESNISTIGYNSSAEQLVVAYTSGCIDLLSADGTVFPILDIKRKNISGKSINSMYQLGSLCYLACSFGIVVIDIAKQEIKDTYIIGSDASYLNVNQVATDDNYIYAATDDGLMTASLTSNLLDYSNWGLVNDSTVPSGAFWFVMNSGEKIYAVSKKEDEDYGEKVYSLSSSGWQSESWGTSALLDIKFVDDYVAIASDYSVIFYNPSTQERSVINKYSFMETDKAMLPKSLVVDESGILWLVDSNYGAIRYDNSTFEKITPSGPVDDLVFSLTYNSGNLWVSRGGVTKAWGNTYTSAIIQYYDGSEWNAIDGSDISELTNLRDVIQVLPFPNEPNHIYVSVYGNGILEINDGELVKEWDQTNSTLEQIIEGDASMKYIRVGGMAFDDEGNLWVSNGEVSDNLHKLSTDGTWTAYSLPNIANQYNAGKVLVAQDGNIWLVVPRGLTSGLYVMSSDGTQKKQLSVKSYFSNSEEESIVVMNNVYDIAQDEDGIIWVATSKGVTTYASPSDVFDEDPFYAYQPAMDEGDDIYHRLLETETVTCIAIDGANRKWFGTSGSGIYLISSDGEHELEHFTSDDTPLISDDITSLAYDGDDGILYIGTSSGLMAYCTESKSANSTFTNVYAYPNPVRPDYTGDIYITGLLEETNVKITTISGRLVYETTSLGGQAVWPVTDLAGNRVHTGVYLVFCASSDGTQSEATKILFIR